MTNIAIFASGNGSNAENLILHFKEQKNVEIKILLSNKADSFVLKRAEKLGIKSATFSPIELRESLVVDQILEQNEIDFIVLAGFLLLMPKRLTDRYDGKILNIHPSLLPKFGGKGMYGINVHRAVIEAQESESGITIHQVNSKFDDGGIIFQAKCPVSTNDTPESLADKIAALESYYFPVVVEEFVNKTTL